MTCEYRDHPEPTQRLPSDYLSEREITHISSETTQDHPETIQRSLKTTQKPPRDHSEIVQRSLTTIQRSLKTTQRSSKDHPLTTLHTLDHHIYHCWTGTVELLNCWIVEHIYHCCLQVKACNTRLSTTRVIINPFVVICCLSHIQILHILLY